LFSLEFFIILYCECKKKKKEQYSESECVVCIFFMDVFFMIKLQRIKNNLIFWFAHGEELWTYT